jgi:adenylate cyclase
VVGKKEPVRIYEVLGEKGQIDENVRNILPHFNQGISHYRKWEWKEAIECFKKALKIHEDDGPSQTYLKRCITFLETPPPDNWDGVFSMTTK